MEEIKQKPEIHSFQAWIACSDIVMLKDTGTHLLEEADFKILNFSEYLFPGGGYTALWMLGESHLALHLFMPEGKAFFDLASCNGHKSRYFIDRLKAKFGKKSILSAMESYTSAK